MLNLCSCIIMWDKIVSEPILKFHNKYYKPVKSPEGYD